ncbi:MAG: conjugal transfer protein [Euzebya sp.]
MSTTGARPPLFDPDPEQGPSEGPSTPPQFPLKRSSGRDAKGRKQRGGNTPSPAWVRPFIIGGLVLIALVTLLSLFTGNDGGDPSPSSTTVPAQSDPVVQPGPDSQASSATRPVGGTSAVATDPTPSAQASPPVDDVPVAGDLPADLQVATAFAVQFAHDYLNLSEANPQIRERELRAYLAPGLDSQLGWDGLGEQLAVLTVPLDVVRTDNGVVVTVASQVTGSDAPRWVHLAVPLAQDGNGRWAVIAPPAFVPRPQAGTPEPATNPPVDEAQGATLQPKMQELFTVFAEAQTVQIDGITADGSRIRGLSGQQQLASVGQVEVFVGDGDEREAQIQVAWRDPVTNATFTQRYRLSLVANGNALLVSGISAG